MWRYGGILGLLWAQTFYIQVKPSAQALKAALEQASRDTKPSLRLGGPVWQGLQKVEEPFLDGTAFPELEGWFVVHFAGQDPTARYQALLSLPEVSCVEPAGGRHLCHGEAIEGNLLGWHHVALQTAEAWTRTQGTPNVVIALIDSGTEWDLPAFYHQLWINAAEDLNGNRQLDSLDLNGIDDDGNGLIDDVIGYDFTDQPYRVGMGDYIGPDPWPADQNGHGTAMASLMVGRPDRSPVAGIAPGCRVMVLRCFEAGGYGEDDDIARAIVYAARQGARVINCSFGDERPSRLMQAAIAYAYRLGAVVVAASGNGTGARSHYPSGFPETIAAGGLAYDEGSGSFYLWPLSGYFRVDWIAPASSVPALLPDGSVQLLSGTSVACALSSAAAALLLSAYPSLSPEDVRATLAARALPLGAQRWSPYSGSGRLVLLPALDHPQAAHAGWLYPPADAVVTGPVPLVFSTYHSLLAGWEVAWASSLEAPWQVLRTGTQPSIRDTFLGWVPPLGKSFLRLRLTLRNGQEVAYTLSLQGVPLGLSFHHLDVSPAWQNGFSGNILRWHLNAATPTCVSAGPFRACADKLDTVGSVWLPAYADPSTQVEAYGLTDTLRQSLTLADRIPRALPYAPWMATALIAPGGFYFPETGEDWNGDGLPDLVVSGIDPTTGRLGRLYFLRQAGSAFVPYDSIPGRRLLPRDIRDWDGNGEPELLCVWIDSFFVFGGSPPKNLLYAGQGRAARLDAGQTVWLRTEGGSYLLRTTSGQELRLLSDTVPWAGNTTVPRLIRLHTAVETLWAFGNYPGWIFLYTPTGQLQKVLPTDLWEVGSHLLSYDVTGDGSEELIYLGQGKDGQWWELGVYQGPSWVLRDRVRFWGGVSGQARLIAGEGIFGVWLPPYLYVARFQGGAWSVRAFDAEIWGAFGLWTIAGDTLFLLGRDSVPRFYRLVPPFLPAPAWAKPGALSPTQVRLRWYAVPGATGYELFRVEPTGNLALRYTGGDTIYVDSTAAGGAYYYLVRALGGAFSEPFFVQPGERPCLDTAWIDSTGLCYVEGNGTWAGESTESFWIEPGPYRPALATAVGKSWLLQFGAEASGAVTLLVDTLLTDVQGRYLRGDCGILFLGRQVLPSCVTPVSWRIVGEKEVEVLFSGGLPAQALDKAQYRLTPVGEVEAISPVPGGLRFRLSVGPSVWPIELHWGWQAARCPSSVAFSPRETSQQTWGVFPNPCTSRHRFVQFWGLPAGTDVRVLTAEGTLCAQFQISGEETPIPWEPRSLNGERLAPGLYLIYVRRGEWQATEKLFLH
ncbi:MAG: S8 family serine peptidase [Bacteroidia bacterium]|nr:S8 family serine peptidase [Bacteroidia bacterium]GIV23616.1 MAG: hypothetical protein KatS3mg025_1275 [Bacteroidia bacterium]